jgi:sensor domain CHASE-containing protein
MKIGQKIALALLAITATMVGMFVAFQRPALIENFRELQFKKAKQDLSRSHEVISTELVALGKLVQDWGNWDDTFLFVQGKNDDFTRVNLNSIVFDTTSVDLIFIVDSKGKLIHGAARLPNGKVIKDVKGFDFARLTVGTKKRPGPGIVNDAIVSGVDSIEGYPMMIQGGVIRDSAQEHSTKAAIFMGRFLLPKTVKGLSTAISVPFRLETTANVPPDPHLATEQSMDQPKSSFHSRSDTDDDINCYKEIRSTSGSSQFFVRSQTDPDILRDGTSTVDQVVQFVTLVSILASAFGLLFVHVLVAAPLFSLANRVSQIGEDTEVQVGGEFVRRKDELGILARHFQEALGRLSQTQIRLIHASREAGMADVARGVLHNAGNVLNSVTVSVKQLKSLSGATKVAGLKKTVSLIEDNHGALGEFFHEDERGTQILPYLGRLADVLENEHKEFRSEVDDLNTLTTHLCEVVQAQHVFTEVPIQEGPIHLDKVLAEAVQIVSRAFERHNIEIVFRANPECVALGDQFKLLQVLVNVLTNGKEAFSSETGNVKVIKIEGDFSASGLPQINIQDNGKGIDPENLTQIFRQGFSTKESSIGYGLHYCANALTEMGWSIRAESDGLNLGARFIITGKRYARKEEVA